MGVDSRVSYEEWNRQPIPNRAGSEIKWREMSEPYTKKAFKKYLTDTLGEDYSDLRGTLRIEQKINGRREEMPEIQGFEEMNIIYNDNGTLMRWRGDDGRFNIGKPLRVSRNSRIGILTDPKSGKEAFFIRNTKTKDGNKIETNYIFTS